MLFVHQGGLLVLIGLPPGCDESSNSHLFGILPDLMFWSIFF